MNAHKVSNVFINEDLELLNDVINNGSYLGVYKHIGRLQIKFDLPEQIATRLTEIVNSISEKPLSHFESAIYVEYSNKYGNPDLPPHVDGGSEFGDLIVDFQIDSNTSWDIGVGLESYPIEDNSALLFNPNTGLHWRPKKRFEDGEYVKMIFFRFYSPSEKTVYPVNPYPQNGEFFKQVVEFRNSL